MKPEYIVLYLLPLLILASCNQQVEERKEELEKIGPESDKITEQLQAAEEYCARMCEEFNKSQPLRSCLTYGTDATEYGNSEAFEDQDYMDLSGDGEEGYDQSYLSGVGVCEEDVPCPTLVNECEGKVITLNNCLDIVENYVEQEGEEGKEFVNNLLREPTQQCKEDAGEDIENHWYNEYEDRFEFIE